jgi:hypothetical protein
MMFSSFGKVTRVLQPRRFHAHALSIILDTKRAQWEVPPHMYVALSVVAPLMTLILMKDEQTVTCEKARPEPEKARPEPIHQTQPELRKSEKVLTRNFIADAASCIAPSVVNIVAASHGLIPIAQAGTGFVISEVFCN